MIRILLLAGVAALVCTAAQAADLPVYKAPVAPVVYNPWTGFYFGIHGGYGWGEYSPSIDISPVFSDPQPSGYVFGAQAGYNYQWNSSIVGGLEIDYSFTGLKDSQGAVINGVPVPGLNLSSKVDSLASVRGKVGYLFNPNIMVYGTAGFGFAHDVVTINVGPVTNFTAATNDFGWVAGGGVEFALTQAVLLRAEYLHYGFGDVAHSFQPIGTINSRLDIDVVRAGASYKF